jgi:ribosome biogenesis protein BMS1
MEQGNRPHRKTKEKKGHASGQPNPKAFAFAKPGRLQKAATRSHDVGFLDLVDWIEYAG